MYTGFESSAEDFVNRFLDYDFFTVNEHKIKRVEVLGSLSGGVIYKLYLDDNGIDWFKKSSKTDLLGKFGNSTLKFNDGNITLKTLIFYSDTVEEVLENLAGWNEFQKQKENRNILGINCFILGEFIKLLNNHANQ